MRKKTPQLVFEYPDYLPESFEKEITHNWKFVDIKKALL